MVEVFPVYMEFGEEIMFNTNQVETLTLLDTFADGLVLDPHQLLVAFTVPKFLYISTEPVFPIILLKLIFAVP